MTRGRDGWRLPLTPERLAAVQDVFHDALARPEGERQAFLDRACAHDDTLREEVAGLLAIAERQAAADAAHDAAHDGVHDAAWNAGVWSPSLGRAVEDAIARAVAEADADTDATLTTPARIGARVGPYEITRLIGMGGMGAVYEGVRADDQYHKRVALKFLRRGVEGELAARRFRYERQILANLSHRNIAALLDGGLTEDGYPYFVMEYVDGVAITTHANERALGVRERMGLLRQVCNAVQHAHQNLVVHRDLKPGNILVTSDGTVKLLDFGIARLLREAEGLDQLPPTQGGAQAFTPDYASPEQVRGMPVGTPSDVYSLGVITCELLTGHRPFALDGLMFSDMQATICTQSAPTPSTLVTPADATAFGSTRAQVVQRQLRGDLDAIMLQALRKEPDRRYGSAEQLGLDLQRHLDGQPVSAQRDRFGYRAAKFLRRRRIEVAAGVLVVTSLTAGLVTARAQTRRAQIERAKTEQVNGLLSTMLAAVDPGNEGVNVTVAQMLAQAARTVQTASLDPEVEAQLRHTIGQTYIGLGLPDSAAVHLERAVALRRQIHGTVDARTSNSLSYLAGVAEARGDLALADSIGAEVLRIQLALSPRQPSGVASAYDNLSRFAGAQGRLDSSMVLQQQAIAIRRSSTDSTSVQELPYSLNNLAVSHMYRGEFAQAEALILEGLETEARANGRETLLYGSMLRQLATVETPLGRPDSATAAALASIGVLGKIVAHTHPEYLSSQSALAGLRNAAEDWPATEAAARIVVDAIGDHLHESHPQSAVALQYLGFALAGQGRVASADSALERSLALRVQYLPADHWAIASSRSVLGHHYGRTGRVAAGLRLLRGAYRTLEQARGADADVTRQTARRLAEVLTIAAQPQEAARWQAIADAPASPPSQATP